MTTGDVPDIVLCDLDGVVWLGGEAIPGSVEAIDRLRHAGLRVVFVTNSSAPTIGEHTAALARIGVDADGGVVSSASAAAELVDAGERVLVCGGPGIAEAVESAGAIAIEGSDATGIADGVDAVVAGFHRTFDYLRLQLATAAVRGGARFIATNRDPLLPTPAGPIPGGGSIVAAIATATGVEPDTAGKPYPPMARAVMSLLGGLDDELRRRRLVVVGDQAAIDGRFAAELGCRFALVRSGTTPMFAVVEPAADYDDADLGGVVNQLLAAPTPRADR
jgi:HAD superfamily hydrolase (TIGR01450 family)